MKRLLILVLAASLFTACNNKAKTSTTRDKDDYSKQDTTKADKDKGMDKDNTNNKDNNKDNNNDNNNNSSNNGDNNTTSSGGGWSSSEVDAFVTNCVSSAVGGGMQQSRASSYCTCMEKKLETLYPDVNDAGKLTEEDMNSPSMKRLVKDCLF